MSSIEQQATISTVEPRKKSGWWTNLKARIGVYEPDLTKTSVVEGFLVCPCKGTRLKAPLEVIEGRKHILLVNIVMLCMIGIEFYSNWKIGFALLVVYVAYLGRFVVKTFLSK
jgi:hypothetical protein